MTTSCVPHDSNKSRGIEELRGAVYCWSHEAHMRSSQFFFFFYCNEYFMYKYHTKNEYYKFLLSTQVVAPPPDQAINRSPIATHCQSSQRQLKINCPGFCLRCQLTRDQRHCHSKFYNQTTTIVIVLLSAEIFSVCVDDPSK